MAPPTILADLLEYVVHALGEVFTVFAGRRTAADPASRLRIWIGWTLVLIVVIAVLAALA
jgi:hypothetical protein